ncbi:hypothetical protein CHS0354_016078 [Potamilus streckersoni]|uniref:5'-(N(7)-methylguanosine 5'-triphospho)-[mRNA] hydrolase n=1 Tax=Potamilus streckersoni TaxID=2493646 RepID=A0AAE0T201_9BIVA|nr:hypothetical protein CHS0354_016078 [Potamilus streckersoni]
MAEGRMNLAALKQRDPYISDIVDRASHVALYTFNAKTNEWEKTSVVGSLFVYKRSAFPVNGFMILNRLGLNNLIEPITKDLEFQLQDPFLLYRNAKSIYGIWFYDKDECAKVGQLMNSLLQLAIEHYHAKSQGSQRQRRASESDSIDRNGIMTRPQQPSQVDILQMLSKAQHEYDKTKATSNQKKTEPRPKIDNPNAAATKGSNLIRPTPLKLPDIEDSQTDIVGSTNQITPTASSAPITLETLFRSASLHHQTERATGYSGTEIPSSQKSTLLQTCV